MFVVICMFSAHLNFWNPIYISLAVSHDIMYNKQSLKNIVSARSKGFSFWYLNKVYSILNYLKIEKDLNHWFVIN